MPKLLPNLRDELLQQATCILRDEGYTALSVRSLANRCNVATGTIYNYFDSKDAIVAQIMMVDWREVIAELDTLSTVSPELTAGMQDMYHALSRFVSKYRGVWSQFAQSGGSSNPLYLHHAALRAQLASPIAHLLERTADPGLLPLSSLLAETLLAAAVQPDIDEHPLLLLMQRLSISSSTHKQEE